MDNKLEERLPAIIFAIGAHLARQTFKMGGDERVAQSVVGALSGALQITANELRNSKPRPEAADEITRLNAEKAELHTLVEEFRHAWEASEALVDEMREGLENAVSALESWKVSPIGGCEKLRTLITKASRDSGHG